MADRLKPSAAWRNEVFASPQRIDVERTTKATTRHPVGQGWTGDITYANGGHERVAMLILEHLWIAGFVKRWKGQPFNLKELNGPNLVPDLLAELRDSTLHVIECKAHRFITPDVQEKFNTERAFLEPMGFRFHVWTNRNRLSSATSHTVAELERGRTYPAEVERIREIGAAALSAKVLGDLTSVFGWDDTLSAAAHGQFHFNFMRPIDEETPILLHPAEAVINDLFERRHEAPGWWDQLRPAEARAA